MSNHVALMAKLPEIGKVKTRLAESLGNDTALEIYKDLLKNTYERCHPTDNSKYKFGVFVDPYDKINEFQDGFPLFDFYYPQTDGDLGKRMNDAFHCLLVEEKANKVILIGSDIPNLNRSMINKTFEILEDNDVVYGPTEDGGYYLIGMKKLHIQLFENIEWGESDVLSTSLDKADSNNISYYLLESLPDLDTIDDMINFPDLFKKYVNKKAGI